MLLLEEDTDETEVTELMDGEGGGRRFSAMVREHFPTAAVERSLT